MNVNSMATGSSAGTLDSHAIVPARASSLFGENAHVTRHGGYVPPAKSALYGPI